MADTKDDVSSKMEHYFNNNNSKKTNTDSGEAGTSTSVEATCSSSSTSLSSSTKPILDTAGPSTSKAPAESSSGDVDKELLAQALQSMQHGKRHLIIHDYENAVPFFEFACEALNQCYGPKALECAECYLYYGTALYESYRIEEGVDGGIVKAENEQNDEDGDDEEDEEGDEEAEAEGEADEENDDNEDNEADVNEAKEESKDNKEAENKEDDAEAATKDTTRQQQQEQQEKDNSIDLIECQPSTSKGITSTSTADASNGDQNENDEKNVLNIEIAFEVLVAAKEIYGQHLDKKNYRLNYAEALQKIGEILIDWENIDGAIDSLNECLEHRQAVLEPDDRLIAVTYHYLGLAHTFKLDAQSSNGYFKKALDVIQLRIDNLKKKELSNMDTFEILSHDTEIQQLESLIPELKKKIEDMNEQIESHCKTMFTIEMENKQEAANNTKQESLKDKPINNVSHLVKRKREDIENNADNNTTITTNNSSTNSTNLDNSNSINKKICSESTKDPNNSDGNHNNENNNTNTNTTEVISSTDKMDQ